MIRDMLNEVRGFHYLLGVFRNQQDDPFCSVCSAFANTVQAVREGLAQFEADHADGMRSLSPAFAAMLEDARTGLASLPVPAHPSGQKKAGNCRLPEGVCFLKASRGVIQRSAAVWPPGSTPAMCYNRSRPTIEDRRGPF